MTPIVRHGRHMTQLNVTPIYADTKIQLVQRPHHVVVYENDQLVDILEMPLMRIVRAIRLYMLPNAILEVR
jgi:hypothetical protein